MPINRRQFNHRLIGGLLALPLRGIPLQAGLAVNGKRIVDRILALAEFGKNPQGGVSRVAYSDADKQGQKRDSTAFSIHAGHRSSEVGAI